MQQGRSVLDMLLSFYLVVIPSIYLKILKMSLFVVSSGVSVRLQLTLFGLLNSKLISILYCVPSTLTYQELAHI